MNDYYVIYYQDKNKYYGFCDQFSNTYYVADTEEKALEGIKWLVGEINV